MKKRKEHFNLKEEYKKSWEFIKESRNFIYFIVILFFLFGVIGFIIPAPEVIKIQILDFINELLQKTEKMSLTELIGFIFLNNAETSFFGMTLGILLGIFPIFFTIANGYILGFVASMAVKSSEGFLILWRILPHGVFELPAVFISLGLGLRLGMFFFKKKKTKSFEEWIIYIISSLKVFLFIIAPLLIIAAVIEGILIFLG